MKVEKHKYQIAWEWRHLDEAVKFDDLVASTAEMAIRRLRKKLREEYSMERSSDVVILEVYRI